MSAKNLTPQQKQLLRDLSERMLLTIRFIRDVQEFPSAGQLQSIIESATARGDLRALKLMSRDVDMMTLGLAPHERDGLEAVLQKHAGVDTQAERAEWRRRVRLVLKRGSIVSEKERQHLEDYAERLEASGDDPEELRAVRRLLGNN